MAPDIAACAWALLLADALRAAPEAVKIIRSKTWAGTYPRCLLRRTDVLAVDFGV